MPGLSESLPGLKVQTDFLLHKNLDQPKVPVLSGAHCRRFSEDVQYIQISSSPQVPPIETPTSPIKVCFGASSYCELRSGVELIGPSSCTWRLGAPKCPPRKPPQTPYVRFGASSYCELSFRCRTYWKGQSCTWGLGAPTKTPLFVLGLPVIVN